MANPWWETAPGGVASSITDAARFVMEKAGVGYTVTFTVIKSTLKTYFDTLYFNVNDAFSFITFNTNPSGVPTNEGTIFHDPETHMPAYKSDIGDATHNFGLEDWTRVRNNGTPITNGMAVVGTSAFSAKVFNVLPAIATPTGPIGIVGIATNGMPDTADQGWATTRGHVADYDTQTPGWSEFDYLYVSATVAGALTTTPPTPPNYAIPVGFVSEVGLTGSIYIFAMNPGMIIAATDAAVASGDPTGFHDGENIDVAYDSTTRKVTLTGDLKYSWRGQVKELTPPWVSDAHADVLDTSYFLYTADGTTFGWTDTPWGFTDVMAAFIWYGTADKYALREVHGLMPWQAHEEFHYNIGTYKVSGGALAAYVLDSTTAADRRPSVAALVVKDEDCRTTNALLNSSLYTKGYLASTGIQSFTVETADIVPLNGDVPYYNEFSTPNWVQTPMSNNTYMCVWLVGVPTTSDADSQKYRYMWVQGQTAGSLLSQEALFPQDLSFGNLSTLVTEFVFSTKIIIRYTSANWRIHSVTNLTGSQATTVGAPAGVFLSTVTTDTSLTGDGTVASPLSASVKLDHTGGTLTNYTETEAVGTLSGGTYTFDLANGNSFHIIATEATVFTLPALPAAGKSASFVAIVDPGGANAISIAGSPASKWLTSDNLIPTFSATAGDATVFTGKTDKTNSRWLLFLGGVELP